MRVSSRLIAVAQGALAALAWAAAPDAALAEWRRAETRSFLVYTNGSERNLRDYAIRLERFDGLMRRVMGVAPPDDERKLSVYLVANGRELRVAQPDLPEGVDGFYRATPKDIRAILVRGQGDDLLLHEYGHHFLYRNFPGGYPGWFSEGFAEYFKTATVDARGRSTVGNAAPGQLQFLTRERWMPMEDVLRARPFELNEAQRRAFYVQSWLLTHYLLADTERRGRLSLYLTDIGEGADRIEALNARFGLTPETLTQALRAYLNGTMRYAELTIPATEPEMTVAPLSASADDLMLINLNIKDGASDEEGPQFLAQIRTAAARHPGDPFALEVLGRAELAWGDDAAGEAALQQVLAAQPDNVEALLMLADLRLEAGDQAPDQEGLLVLYREAQGMLGRAYQADPTDYRVLSLLARMRRGVAEDYPTENDLNTWRLAVQYAPQVPSVRGEAADAMVDAGRYDEAEALLAPLANDPHGGGNARMARDRLERIRARRAAAAENPAADEPSA